MLISEKTSAEIQAKVEVLYGATLDIEAAEDCGDTVMKSLKESLNVLMVLKVLATEESRPKLEQERHVKLGLLNLHSSIKRVLVGLNRNQTGDKKPTFAETQMMIKRSGVLLPIQIPDLNIVTQFIRMTKEEIKKISLVLRKILDTEVHKLRQIKANCA
jgi:hypothetical protein